MFRISCSARVGRFRMNCFFNQKVGMYEID
nr:MAG TPA: hypothetical protein [Caudoviricetes sp.]